VAWQFPLLARCGALHKLVTAAVEAGEDEVKIEEFPGSAECFEICAKFCYGVTITLNAHNVGEARCGAEYLKMSENVEKSNLVYKLEVFLNSSILRGWKDSIICLQSSKDCQPWCEDLNVSSIIPPLESFIFFLFRLQQYTSCRNYTSLTRYCTFRSLLYQCSSVANL
jgi:hypothetical protein